MDAFDYFLLVFVISDVAKDFDTTKTKVAVATTLTLAARPVGAALFGYWADKVGRRTPLLVCVLFYSLVEFSTGFSTSLTMLIALRCLYGVGMGGEWGLGASLAMEKIPVEKRGFFSGVLQQGYPVGYMFAAIAFFIVTPIAGWRGLFSSSARCRRCSRSGSDCASRSPRSGRRRRSASARRRSASARSFCSRASCGASCTSCCSWPPSTS
jgi:MFS transporter, SHS family, lactate transporter